MRWLIFARPRRNSDRGAAAVLLSLVIVGAFLTLGAVALNVGNWYSEKGQTQNGSDGAAIAIAQACASSNTDTTTCNSSLSNPAATQYATSNANDGAATVNMICGNAPDANGSNRLTPCSGSNPCPGCPGGAANLCPAGTGTYVDVQIAKGGGQALLGGFVPGGQDPAIGSCAQATYSAANSGDSLAFTMSYCNWSAATNGGTEFAPAPPYATWPPAGVTGYPGASSVPAPNVPNGEQVLLSHGSGNDCVASTSGAQVPGGFGWLDDPDGNCQAFVDVDNTYHDDTGNDAPADCKDLIAQYATSHATIFIPIYDNLTGSGSNATYHLAGLAAFVITGAYLKGRGPTLNIPSTITGQQYCDGDQRCIYGFFTQGLVPNSTGGSGLNGATAAYLTG